MRKVQNMKRPAEQIEREREIQMMTQYEKWPNLVLPLKHDTERWKDGMRKIAILIPPAITDFWLVYPDINMWALDGIDWQTVPRIQFTSAAAIYDAGWRVD